KVEDGDVEGGQAPPSVLHRPRQAEPSALGEPALPLPAPRHLLFQAAERLGRHEVLGEPGAGGERELALRGGQGQVHSQAPQPAPADTGRRPSVSSPADTGRRPPAPSPADTGRRSSAPSTVSLPNSSRSSRS